MNTHLKNVLIDKYIQIKFIEFYNIVQDAVPEIGKMKNSQFHGLVNLVKNPAYENVDTLKSKLEENNDRLWHEEYPGLFQVLDNGFGRLENLAERINNEIINHSEGSFSQIGLSSDEIHLELVRAYIISAVKLHLGR